MISEDFKPWLVSHDHQFSRKYFSLVFLLPSRLRSTAVRPWNPAPQWLPGCVDKSWKTPSRVRDLGVICTHATPRVSESPISITSLPVLMNAESWYHKCMFKAVCTCHVVPAVVVDRREERDCDTGRFELAYKQVCVCLGLFEFDDFNTCLHVCCFGNLVPSPPPSF